MVALAQASCFAQEKITFASDQYRLEGVLHRPRTRPRLVVIGSHGLLSSGDSPKQVDLAYHLNCAGIAFFRFDHRGCGTSQGDFVEGARLANRVCDLRAAAQMLCSQADCGAPVGFFGSSLGGAACLAAATHLATTCLVTLAAPIESRALHAANRRWAKDAKLPAGLLAQLDFDLQSQLGAIAHLLIVHGAEDMVVPVAHAHTLYARCGEPKELLVLPGADHRLSQPAHRQQFVAAACKWFASCAPAA